MSALYQTNMLHWIIVVSAHRNNSPCVDMSLHSDTLSLFKANQSLFLLFKAACFAGEAPNINFIIFGLTRSGINPMFSWNEACVINYES